MQIKSRKIEFQHQDETITAFINKTENGKFKLVYHLPYSDFFFEKTHHFIEAAPPDPNISFLYFALNNVVVSCPGGGHMEHSIDVGFQCESRIQKKKVVKFFNEWVSVL
jgi:hypothetical protein